VRGPVRGDSGGAGPSRGSEPGKAGDHPARRGQRPLPPADT
jgi:hypothetical protein